MRQNPEKIVRIATIGTLSFMVVWGLVSVAAQIRPFWVDEWRVIYNLKFKDAAALWGPMDFMQQFPRVYLELIKAFSSRFGYSYTALRLPSYLAGTATILLSYRLANRLYARDHFNRFLFVMVLISCETFTKYFVQVKQYSMDLLLSLVVIWQLMELLQLNKTSTGKGKYALLCISFLVVPWFSYSYPVAVAPVFMVIFLQGVFTLRAEGFTAVRTILARQWFPLLLGAASIGAFYVADVAQLMADKGMNEFWGHLMMDHGFNWPSFLYNFFNLFAEIGAGEIYWRLFGVLGLCSLFFGLYVCAGYIKAGVRGTAELMRMYSVLLLVFVLVLFCFGKLPVGEPRLNAFTTPAISILIIFLLDHLYKTRPKLSRTIAVVLYIGVIGNIYTTFFASITGDAYTREMSIYKATEEAIAAAQAKNIPILITPEVAYPYDKTRNLPFTGNVPGDWVLKTFPAYQVATHIPVYGISDMAGVGECMKALPPEITTVVAGNGISYQVVNR